MIDFNKPIRIFYANLLHIGVNLYVNDGKLRVSGNLDSLSPVYREEIVKRKDQLIELLSTRPPEALAAYFDRLIPLPELREALWIAEQNSIKVKALPVNGGWLLEMEQKAKAGPRGLPESEVQP